MTYGNILIFRFIQAKEEDSVYRNYYEAAFSVKKVQGHQILAMNRGENEEFLKVGIEYNRDNALQIICSRVISSIPCISETAGIPMAPLEESIITKHGLCTPIRFSGV